MSDAAAARQHGLAPAVAADARVIVLGSFPSTTSLCVAQYYAHPRNHFWPLMAEVLDEPLATLPYEQRLARLRARRVALWDTIEACERRGSLDANIRNADEAGAERIRHAAPRLAAACFNGARAARAGAAWRAAGCATLALPSSSPAYTLPYATKRAAWLAIRQWL